MKQPHTWGRLLLLLIFCFVVSTPVFSQNSGLTIYGFFDFESEVSNKDGAGKRWTFDQHHLNILVSDQLDPSFSVLSELEWEHGPMHSPGESSGNIYLARAYLQWKYSDAFRVRIGKFMSPFGLYNERHDATPTFLFTFLPESVYGKKELSFGGKGRVFAKHSTGIQCLGDLFFSGWEGRYQIYLGNGRGPRESEKDNNPNKGLGWRFVLSPPIGVLHLGTSYYVDRNGNANDTRQSALGFDIETEVSDLHLEGEFFLPKLEQTDTSGIPNGSFKKGKGYYLLAAYTFFTRITPFARYDFFDPDTRRSADQQIILTLGINWALTAKVYLKNEIYFYRFQNPGTNGYEMAVASIAVAF